MPEPELHVVTGAFSYTGKYITRRLLDAGVRVRTLTNHPRRTDPLADRVEVAPLAFHDIAQLAESLRGATTLYNTYWIRFSRGESTFARAIANTKALVAAAESAGVRRIVHVSIANPSLDSPLPYYRGKAEVEQVVTRSRLAYTILRPTVIFGDEDILLNNIAWLLRRFPLFAVPGDGGYGVQPIFVDDMAALAVEAARGDGNATDRRSRIRNVPLRRPGAAARAGDRQPRPHRTCAAAHRPVHVAPHRNVCARRRADA